MFYSSPDAYARVMRSAIAANGSFFNAHRMVSQYLDNAWFRDEERESAQAVNQPNDAHS